MKLALCLTDENKMIIPKTSSLKMWVCMLLLTYSAQPVFAANESWIVTLQPQAMPQFFQRPNTKLPNLVRVSVTGRYTADASKPEETPYEDLFYSSGRAIGARRHSPLAIGAGTLGVVEILEGPLGSTGAEKDAACGAIARLIVDINLRRAAVKRMVIPDGSFDAVVEGLRRYGFKTSPPISTTAPLIVVCEFDVISKSAQRHISMNYAAN